MNLLKRTSLFEKLHRSFEKYSIPTKSMSRTSRDNHIENLQTRFRNFLERTDDKNGKNNEFLGNKLKAHSHNYETSSVIASSCEKNPSEYDKLVATVETHLLGKKRSKPLNTLGLIDDRCCRLLGKLSKSEILNFLHLLMRTRFDITKLKLYRSSLLALRKHLEKDRLSVNERLQLLFFEGLGKKSAKRNVKFLINFLPPLSDLSEMQRCVVAHATFKCCVRLSAKDVRSLEELLEERAAELVEDPPILGTICKAVAYAGTTNDFSIDHLSREIVANNGIFTIMSAAQILSLCVEANHENSMLTERLFRDSMKNITDDRKKLHLNEVRIKDADKLLWALSVLNYRMEETHAKELSSFVHRRYEEFEKKPFLLVNTLLALWILNCRLHEIIERCCTRDGIFRLVKEEKKLWKPGARLRLLLNCVRIETPVTKLPNEIIEERRVGMKIDKRVRRLHVTIEKMRKKLDIEAATIDCPVDGIYIAGVSLRRGKKLIHVDLLNETTCFRGSNVLHGLTSLKLRLMEKIGFDSILITDEQSNDAEFVALSIARCIDKGIRDTSQIR